MTFTNLCILYRFLGQGEFGEVFQGTAYDILGPDTGPHPVAIKVLQLYLHTYDIILILITAVYTSLYRQSYCEHSVSSNLSQFMTALPFYLWHVARRQNVLHTSMFFFLGVFKQSEV